MNLATDEGGRLNVLVYCEADLNLIDGSSIWTSSVTQVLARCPGARVTLLLKRPLSRSLLAEPLAALQNVALCNPWSKVGELESVSGDWVHRERLLPAEAAELIASLDERERFDLVLVRGLRLCRAVVEQPSLEGRVWAYLTDFTDEDVDTLRTIHARASRLLCQTDELREHVCRMLRVNGGKLLLLPPMIPDLPDAPPSFARRGQKLVYVGKLAPLWRTEEMVRAMPEIRRRHPEAELHVAGDKFHNFPHSADFPARMRRLLEETSGVVWRQAMSREDTQQLIASCDVGCSWRHSALDSSLELSTKVLEYGSKGKPALLNRVPMHEKLLGADYPLFCNTSQEYIEAISSALADETIYVQAARRAWEASRGFTFSAALARLVPHLPQPRAPAAPRRPVRPTSVPPRSGGRTLRVLFAGHDLKFIEDIMARLGEDPELELRVEQWAGHANHDARESRSLAEWADVVVAEWCLGNAVWYSRNLPPKTGLVVRLHRVELETTYPRELNLGNVHRIIGVSPHFVDVIRAQLPSLGDRAVYIPNAVDCNLLDQPKLGGSEFRLGLLGLCPRLKRLDLALDILERLRRRDRRYTLWVKGKLPTEYPWVWRDEAEREYYLEQMARVNRSVWRDSVVFDPFGSDVHVWFRKIGFVLSLSDVESFHLSIAEGMASGAIPVIRCRDEVPGLYHDEYVFSDVREAAAMIERVRHDDDGTAARASKLKTSARENFDLHVVAASWQRTIRSVADEARSA